MVTEVEKTIKESLDISNEELMINSLNQAVEKYNFDIVLTRDEQIIIKTVPYVFGESLLNRVNEKSVARVAQGMYDYNDQEIFIWYSVYRLSDSVFINSFLKTLLIIVLFITLLLGLTFYLVSQRLFVPLKNIKESIQFAEDYEFSKIENDSDNINKRFKTFASNLESNISSVSRQHTELETQLQGKREYLNNILVVSRSMVHDLKTPIHGTIIENEIMAKEKDYNEELVELANLNQSRNHKVMLEINRILEMLKNEDSEIEFVTSEIDVIDTIQRALNSFSNNMMKKGIFLEFDVPEEVILTTKETTFILLINNILSNMVLYATDDTQMSLFVDQNSDSTLIRFSNESSKDNIDRMKRTEKLFNTVKDPQDDGYIYRSGNGLYLIKELSLMLNADYRIITSKNTVIIEVEFYDE